MQCTTVCSGSYQCYAALWKMNRVKEKQLLYKDRKLCRISDSQVFKVIRLMWTVVSFSCICALNPLYSIPTVHYVCSRGVFHCCIKGHTLQYSFVIATLYNHIKHIFAPKNRMDLNLYIMAVMRKAGMTTMMMLMMQLHWLLTQQTVITVS